MTDRERQMIEAYLPNPPDPELGDPYFNYYVMDNRQRVVKVRAANIAWDKYGEEIYQVFTPSGKLVHGDWETDTETFGGGWFHKSALYDNKQDCRDNTHSCWNDWEWLRDIQRKEGLI